MASTHEQGVVQGLYDAVLSHDIEACAKYSAEVLRRGISVRTAVMHGLAAGMERVGELYSAGQYFIPQIILCADTLFAGMAVLKPHLQGESSDGVHTVVLGSAEGDIHEIGRKLVGIMYEAAGWEVHDLGSDVKVERFLEEQSRTGADVIGLSALMTTSMRRLPYSIDCIRQHNPNITIMVGGAPMNKEISEKFGADGFAANCGVVVKETLKAVEKRSKNTHAWNGGTP